MDYTNNDIVACLRQYEMFANSLDMITNPKDRDNIYHQLDRLEEKLIKLTNELYEEEYVTLLNRKTSLLDEEKTRITMLIELISQRLTYIETRKNNHKLLVGHEVNYGSVLGENLLGELEERIKIIEKYTKNIKEKEEILKTLEDVNNKMTLAEEKIKINEALNRELESKMIEVLQGAFIKLKLYDYTKNSEEIEKAYKELEYSLNLARDNVKMAENGGGDILSECEEMMASVKKDYDEYKEKYNILKLMEIFNTKVRSYEDLLNKREKINDIFGNLTNTKLYELTYPEINKEYNTIKIEKQDINTYNYLLIEKNEKDAKIKEIDEENNSEKFRKVLEDLIANEKKKKQCGIDATLINPRFLTGLDTELLENLKSSHDLVITLEDGQVDGGFGEKVTRYYGNSDVKVLNFGAKKEFTDRVPVADLYQRYHLTKELIVDDIKNTICDKVSK